MVVGRQQKEGVEGRGVGQRCVQISAKQKFVQPTLSPLPPHMDLSALDPLEGAIKWLKCFLRCFQQTASISELIQTQGKQSTLIHKTNEISKHSSSSRDH